MNSEAQFNTMMGNISDHLANLNQSVMLTTEALRETDPAVKRAKLKLAYSLVNHQGLHVQRIDLMGQLL